MILGFAHLAINTAHLGDAEEAWCAKGYSRTAMHCDVANHPSKRAFCAHYQPQHDLMLLHGQGLWPLELTWHGSVEGENEQITWSPEVIRVCVADPSCLRQFLVDGLGFKAVENSELLLDNRLPTWSCRLAVSEGDSKPVQLDAVGPTCLAFYCNRIEEDVQRLAALGATDCTAIFDLDLGGRNMSIAMMRLPGGPLLELISPRNRSL